MTKGDLEANIAGRSMSKVLPSSDSCCPALTWTQRIWGYGIAIVIGNIHTNLNYLGLILDIISFFALFSGEYIVFAVTYSLGNVIALTSYLLYVYIYIYIYNLPRTGFIIGFKKQFKKMFAKTRIVVVLIIIASISLAMISAFVWENVWLVLVFIIVEYLALIWYSLSYIPYARKLAKKMLLGCCK